MEELKLIIPTEEYEQQVMAYRDAFAEDLNKLAGGCGLRDKADFKEWLAHVRIMADPETAPVQWVPSTACLAVRTSDNRLVGMVDIRHTLNKHLLHEGGNIGYSVHPDERRKGYAKQMLKLALDKCRELGINHVLVTCDKVNIGSAKVIQHNGGVMENEVLDVAGELTQRYWITL